MNGEQEREYVAYVTARLPALRRIAAQLAGDPHRGDDLVQQAITRLFVKWRQASQARNLDAYLHTILVRTFLDDRRLAWSRVSLAPEAGTERAATGADVDTRLDLQVALGQMPPRQRAAVVLRFLTDRSVDEVAEILQVSPGTVKSQTSDGLATLRRLLGEQPVASATTAKGAVR
ncbi:SigE family RNA polymerase sigma factor [Catellatospora sichuanensis]|uniref:SigE family RNA polymerase sigma factor n=1 Tax=Catellatospora sichuanensis TaxID=1969805 RepID=UPI001183E13E|nr:SigE family RNA polymerase sigma factor [Catellatospora sichuanensis]